MKKKNRYQTIIGIGSFCLFLLGCSKESFLMQPEATSTIVLEESVVSDNERVSEKSEEEIVLSEIKEEKSTVNKQDTQADKDGSYERAQENREIAVHICGAVNQPGVYYFRENQRIYEAVMKAGGFREDADSEYLNQALFLEDGMKITVPTREETDRLKENFGGNSEEVILRTKEDKTGDSGGFLQVKEREEKKNNQEENSKVDLNTADEAMLCTLPGIGESRAKSIIAYRKEHGNFRTTEDIMKVSGIKEAAYEKIREYVTVSQ